ncbi:MAG: type IV pilus assembly protein PilM, partial [Planctomycetota bacterium]
MPSSNACWGIEIGAFALKAIKLEADGDKLKVADYAVIEHPKVLSTPGLDPEDSMRVALGRLIGEHDLSKASIAISVPGHAAFARFAKLPPVEPKKVPDIVKFEAVQQIPFPLEDVEWDYQTFQSPDSPDIEVGIFAMTRERIMQSLRMFRDVELTPDYVSLSPVSVYNAMAYDMEFTEKTPGTILLDVGTTSTDLIIADAGRVWVRTFPMGGHQFTEALVTAFKLSYTKAEKLKKEAEQSKHARHIFQALRPVFTDLVQDVQRSIQYYQQAHPDAQLERLVGLGSTFRLPGLRKYLKQQLGMDTYKLEQFKRVEMEGAGEAEFQALNLNLATAYGMAVQGMGMDTIQANLMPSTMMREAMFAVCVIDAGWGALSIAVLSRKGPTNITPAAAAATPALRPNHLFFFFHIASRIMVEGIRLAWIVS